MRRDDCEKCRKKETRERRFRNRIMVLMTPVLVACMIGVASHWHGKIVYASGARPFTEKVEKRLMNGTTLVYPYHVWDVSTQVESTFRTEAAPLAFVEASELQGTLLVSVPARCTDRAVRWQLSVDGEPLETGTLKWLREYEVPTDFPLQHTPRTITLTVGWNGGSDACPSFEVVWRVPELS